MNDSKDADFRLVFLNKQKFASWFWRPGPDEIIQTT